MTYHSLDYKPEESTPSQQYLEYADVCKDAIRILLKEYMNHRPLHDYSLAPVLYLIRHFIELQLKGIIMYCGYESQKVIEEGHNIISLYHIAREKIEESHGYCPRPNREVEKFIDCLGKLDPKSEAFRYPEKRGGKDFTELFSGMDPWLYEKIMSLPELNDIAEKVICDLEELESFLDFMRYNEEEYFAHCP